MQPHQQQVSQCNQSRQLSAKSSIISRKSTQKQTLKQQITFLKEKVKKLKIDKLNQKMIHQEGRNSTYRTVQSNLKPENERNHQNQQQAQCYQKSQNTQYLMDKQSQNQVQRQPIVHFRVGRIVKNNLQNSQQKHDFRQSKTIEVKNNNYSEGFMFNKPSNSRLTSDHKNSQIHSEQIFRTIESNHKFSFFEDNPVIASIIDLKNGENNDNNYFSRQVLHEQMKRSMINFDETIQSAQLPFPVTSEYRNQDLKINSNIKQKHIFSKSTTFKLPQNFSRTSKAKTDQIWFTSTNPEYHEQQVGDIIRDKNINIRKVSYKLKKPKNTSRDPQIIRKEKLMEEFLKQQTQNQKRTSRYAVGGFENEQNFTEGNVNFEEIKSTVMEKKNFKARMMSKSKVYAQEIEDELKHKLRGKIIKNFGQHDIVEPQQAEPQSQDEFIPEEIPYNKFSLSQIPYCAQRPHSKSNQDQIINLTLTIARKLNITPIKRQPLQGIVIKKFKNCLIFSIPETNKKVIWYYEGRFYFGEGEKQGEQGYKSGQGLEFIPEKSFYKGQFFENRKHGSGIMITEKGNIYQGQWSQGHQNGNGKFYDAQSGRIYEGQFKNGKFDGFGILKISQTQIYKGTFVRNIKHGYGIETFKNGDKYKGEYEQGKFHGKGRYKWSNGNIYEGQFVMGLRTGSGKWKSSKQGGDMYIGMYLSDKKHGLGKYCWADGSVFEGTFEKDEKHGEGILTYKDGKTVHGRWQNNQLIELLSVQNEQQQRVRTFKGEGCDKIELIERVPNQMIRPKRLRNI